MDRPLKQRGHPLEREFPVLRAWSKNLVLVYRADRLHELSPTGFDPRAKRLRVLRVRTELRERPGGLVIYRTWVYLSDRSAYRLEWQRKHEYGSLLDVWQRVPWSAKGHREGSGVVARRRQPRASQG